MGSSVIQILIAIIGSGGLAGGLIALIKVPSDRSTAAVSQSQGAMETMKILNDALNEELGRLRHFADECERQMAERDTMIAAMRDIIHGMEIMGDDKHFPPGTPPSAPRS